MYICNPPGSTPSYSSCFERVRPGIPAREAGALTRNAKGYSLQRVPLFEVRRVSFTQALTGIHIHISGRRCRFYPIKVFLKRLKSDIDTSCSFCDDPNETDMHIFWDCPHTQIFWIEFSNVINRNVLQGFSLLFKDVLFGFFNIQKYQINECFIINLLLLLATFHIHRSKFTHQIPLFIVFFKRGSTVYPNYFISKNLEALKTVNLLHLFNLFC